MQSSIHKRTMCPFYGFNSALLDTNGNGCPWIGDHSSCKMEIEGLRPNWEICDYKESEQVKIRLPDLLVRERIFPEELRPLRDPAWDGISFYYWYNHIISGTPLFPE